MTTRRDKARVPQERGASIGVQPRQNRNFLRHTIIRTRLLLISVGLDVLRRRGSQWGLCAALRAWQTLRWRRLHALREVPVLQRVFGRYALAGIERHHVSQEIERVLPSLHRHPLRIP
jgi:hypothetical protein